MKYRNGIITLGFVVILIRLLGFPEAWRTVLYIITGLSIIALGFFSGRRNKTSVTVTVETPADKVETTSINTSN